jgi:UDP-glucose 4-epimerase
VPRSVVTGAAGFVGSHLADRLLSLGHEVVGVDCFTDYYDRALKEANTASARENARFRLVEGDLCSMELRALLDGADYLFHLAGQAGVRPSWGSSFAIYTQHNIAATQRLLEAAKAASLRKLVFASSSSVYGDAKQLPVTEETLPAPVSPYGVTKLAAEQLCTLYAKVYGLPAVSLRLFTVYGPRQRPDMAIRRFLEAARNGETVAVYGDGEQSRDFTYVQDAVDAFVRALDAPPEERVFNVCGGSRVTVNELLGLIEDVTNLPMRVVHQDAARGDARHTLGDNSRARELLGFRPRVALAEGLREQWQWLRGSKLEARSSKLQGSGVVRRSRS